MTCDCGAELVRKLDEPSKDTYFSCPGAVSAILLPSRHRLGRRGDVIVSKRFVGVLGVTLLLGSCAPTVVQQPTLLTPAVGKTFRLIQTAEVALTTGYSTTLRANTTWQLVGTVTQGEVYRTRDQVVTVEGANIHEGYIVVDQGVLVGFYLPVERTFSPVAPGKRLSTTP